jgi:hypothetical protein
MGTTCSQCSRSGEDFIDGESRCFFRVRPKDLTTDALEQEVNFLYWLTKCQSTHRDPNGDEDAMRALEALPPFVAELARREV